MPCTRTDNQTCCAAKCTACITCNCWRGVGYILTITSCGISKTSTTGCIYDNRPNSRVWTSAIGSIRYRITTRRRCTYVYLPCTRIDGQTCRAAKRTTTQTNNRWGRIGRILAITRLCIAKPCIIHSIYDNRPNSRIWTSSIGSIRYRITTRCRSTHIYLPCTRIDGQTCRAAKGTACIPCNCWRGVGSILTITSIVISKGSIIQSINHNRPNSRVWTSAIGGIRNRITTGGRSTHIYLPCTSIDGQTCRTAKRATTQTNNRWGRIGRILAITGLCIAESCIISSINDNSLSRTIGTRTSCGIGNSITTCCRGTQIYLSCTRIDG